MQLDTGLHIDEYTVSLPSINTDVDELTILAHCPFVLLCVCDDFAPMLYFCDDFAPNIAHPVHFMLQFQHV